MTYNLWLLLQDERQWQEKSKDLVGKMEECMDQGKQEIMVNICCITYNRESYIEDALDGFLKQETDFAYEVLTHDDAPMDKTGEIVREYAKRYPEVIKPTLQMKNQYSKGSTNISGAFNPPRAAGRHVAMCEKDGYWTDGRKLQLQVDYMGSHPDCALRFRSAEMEVLERAITRRAIRSYRGDKAVSSKEIIGKCPGYPTAPFLFRTEVMRNLSGLYVDAPIVDIPLQLLAAVRRYGYHMNRPMCVYRLGGVVSWTSMMKQGDYGKKQRRYFTQMEEMYRGSDREGGSRFREAVGRAIKRLYLLIQMNTRHYDVVLAEESREFYRELNGRTGFLIRLETGMLRLYHWL